MGIYIFLHTREKHKWPQSSMSSPLFFSPFPSFFFHRRHHQNTIIITLPSSSSSATPPYSMSFYSFSQIKTYTPCLGKKQQCLLLFSFFLSLTWKKVSNTSFHPNRRSYYSYVLNWRKCIHVLILLCLHFLHKSIAICILHVNYK